MLVAHSLKELQFDKKSVVTIGTFDGIHLGHRLIISEVVNRAKSLDGRSVVITFEPHPREVLGKGPVMLLTTLRDRLDEMSSLHIDIVLVLEFTYEFSRQTAREFYEKFFIRGIGVSEVVVGYDHMFGRDRKSNTSELSQMGKEYGFGLTIVKPVSVEGEIISSTKIRNLLLRGDVEIAIKYLNRPYSLDGVVIVGDRRGETLGFPTVNILPKEINKLIPADGVYCINIVIDGHRWYGMLNIGYRPTFKLDSERIIEANIFNYDGDLSFGVDDDEGESSYRDYYLHGKKGSIMNIAICTYFVNKAIVVGYRFCDRTCEGFGKTLCTMGAIGNLKMKSLKK